MTESFEPPVVSDISLEAAMLGDTFMVPADREVPPGFRVADGATLKSRQYPEFVAALGIAGSTFTLPAPERLREGTMYIIKVGQEIVMQPLPLIPPTARRQARGPRLPEDLVRRRSGPPGRD